MKKYKKKCWQVAIDSPAAAGAGTQAKLISKYFMLYTISLFIHVQINLFFVTQLESYKFFIEFSYAII